MGSHVRPTGTFMSCRTMPSRPRRCAAAGAPALCTLSQHCTGPALQLPAVEPARGCRRQLRDQRGQEGSGARTGHGEGGREGGAGEGEGEEGAGEHGGAAGG